MLAGSLRQDLKSHLIKGVHKKNQELKPISFFMQTVLKSEIIYMMYVKITATYPFSQVVGQNEISGEGV